MPDRQPWEISYTIRLDFAATFLKYLSVEGRDCAQLQAAYHVPDLHQWARDCIAETLSEAGQEAVTEAVEALEEAGLVGAGPDK